MNCPSSEGLLDQLVKAEELPSPPSVAIKILELDRSESTSLEDLTKVISADPTLTARIIKFCNSPMVGANRQVSSLSQAVVLLGKRAVQMLALSFSLIETESESESQKYDEFWNQSLANAVASQVVCQQTMDRHDEAFIIGLLGNIGQLAVMILMEREFDEIHQLIASQETRDVQSASIAVLGISYCEISSSVLECWSFPSVIVDAIRRYHFVDQHQSRFDRALYVADQMAVVPFVESDHTAIARYRQSASELLAIEAQQQDTLFEEFVKRWRDFANILSLEAACSHSLKELEKAAKQRLVSMTMEVQRENTELATERDQLSKAAVTDALTGLGNRRAFEQRGAEELCRMERTQRPFVLLAIDIDHFKQLNDAHGHLAGDEVLKHVAQCLKDNIRQYDLPFRYGGEEFVMILPECPIETGCQVAERLRSSVEQCKVHFDKQIIHCTISVGVAFADPPANITLESLFADADQRLYEAKNQGRNIVVAPDPMECDSVA